MSSLERIAKYSETGSGGKGGTHVGEGDDDKKRGVEGKGGKERRG